MRLVNSEQQQHLLYKHLLEVFRPKSVEDILGAAKTLGDEEGGIKRRRLVEEREWLLPLWESSLHPNPMGHQEFDIFPSFENIQESKWKGRIQIFFAFLPSHYLKSLTGLPPSLLETLGSSFAWKQETPMAYLELDTTGLCQRAEVSPLLCALMALSREVLNQESWEPRQWLKEAYAESHSIQQEYQRLYPKPPQCFQPEILQPFLKRWSDRLQGLKDLGPFPFFQGWVGIRLSAPLPALSLRSYFEESLQELWETPIVDNPHQEGGFSLSPALEQSLEGHAHHVSSAVNLALHPRKMGWGGPLDGLSIDGQLVFTKIKDALNQPGYLKLSHPLGTLSLPVLQELIGDAWVERAVRLSKLPSPEEGLSPLDPQSPHVLVPMDAFIEHGTFLWVEDGSTSLPESQLLNPSWLFEQSIHHVSARWNVNHFIAHLPTWLKGSDEMPWELAKNEFLQAKKEVEEHLYELTRSIRWVQDWNQVSSREIELDMEHQTKSEHVEQMKKDHVARFEQLREFHQQSKREMQVLEKDLSRFVEQIKKMKDKLSQEKPLPKMDKVLSWVGIQTSYVKQLSEQRKERLLILKRARADRELCKEQLDKIKKHVRKTMREIEELKISHIEKQEILELELATLEREKDEVESKVQKLARHRQDYPSDIEAIWTFWKEAVDYYDPPLLAQNPWEDMSSHWLEDWKQKRHRLVLAACRLHVSVLNVWKPHLENLMPWFEKWQKQEPLKPETVQKLWNVLGLWMPLQKCSVSQAFQLTQSLPKQSIGWLWANEEVAVHPGFSVLLQKSNKVVELWEPTTQVVEPFYASWLQKKLKRPIEEIPQKSSVLIDFHLQTESVSPWFELGNEWLYQEKLANLTEKGEVQEAHSQWICVNPHTRERHQGQGPMDEWAWLNKKAKEWKKQWPQLLRASSQDATLQICVLHEEWKKIVKDILDEVKLSDRVLLTSFSSPPLKTDWVILVLGAFEEKINLVEVLEPLKVQALLRPRYALSILGDPNSWPIADQLPWLHGLPWVEEKCVVSGALKEKAWGANHLQEELDSHASSLPAAVEDPRMNEEDVSNVSPQITTEGPENTSEELLVDGLDLPVELLPSESPSLEALAVEEEFRENSKESPMKEVLEAPSALLGVMDELDEAFADQTQVFHSPEEMPPETVSEDNPDTVVEHPSHALSTPSLDSPSKDPSSSKEKDEKNSHSQVESDLDELFAKWEDE